MKSPSSSTANEKKMIWFMPDARVSISGLLIFLLAFVLMYLPVYFELAGSTWSSDEQGHGPLILGAVAWLFWSGRSDIFFGEGRPALISGFVLLVLSLIGYAIGRSQGMVEVEVATQIGVLASGLLILHGPSALRRSWFPLFFMVFMIPLPGAIVQAVTLPLKNAVSVVAENVLYLFHYPIGRTGVTLTIGPYQLLVADACSGLNSLFTLESLGMLYMNVMNYQSRVRNVMLAIMIVPISFVSNVTRVMVLVLITYYFGDEAGQGFLHGFSGMILFVVALCLTYGFDRLLAVRFDDKEGARGSRH
jgi:exosortase B